MASRAPAPDELAKVQRFVNTLDIESGNEQLHQPDDLLAFLKDEGFVTAEARVSADEHQRALSVREALRALMHTNHGEPADQAAVALLNEAAERGRLVVCFDADGKAALSPCRDGVDAAIGAMLAIVMRSMESGTWDDLKTCQRESCRWAFYDRSKNHSSKWCSMEVCGSREKAKSYRARNKTR